jgi:hypothetical protein
VATKLQIFNSTLSASQYPHESVSQSGSELLEPPQEIARNDRAENKVALKRFIKLMINLGSTEIKIFEMFYLY